MLAGDTVLLDRDGESEALDEVLAAGATGRGAAVRITGEAGIGKSTLVAHLHRRAVDRGFRVLRATGSVADARPVHTLTRQWFAPAVHSGVRGAPPLDGPAGTLVDLVTGSGSAAVDVASVVVGAAWALESLTEHAPVLLVADDAQWADAASWEVLGRLADRAPGLGVVVAYAARTDPAPETAAPPPLARLLGRDDVLALRLGPWGEATVARRLRERIGREPAEETVDMLRQLTRGVPFLVDEQLAALPEDASDVEVDLALRSRSELGLQRSVTDRLGALGPAAVAAARAVAVIGPERAGLNATADVAGIARRDIAAVVDALAQARILESGAEPLRLIHPLVAQAVLEDCGEAGAAQLHARALEVLLASGYVGVDLAGHALRAPAAGDPAVVDLLARAARDAVARGAPGAGTALLQRALREPPPPDRVAELLTQCAEAMIGDSDVAGGIELYRRALARIEDPMRQVEVLIEKADALVFAGEYAEAIDAFERARITLDDHAVGPRHELRRRLLAHASPNQVMLPEAWRSDIWAAATEALAVDPSHDTPADRQLYVTVALGTVFTGGSAEQAASLALRGLDGTRLVREETADSTVLYAATGALLWAGRYAEVRQVLDAALVDARTRGSVLGHATASYCRGCAWWFEGYPHRAVADLRSAVDARELGWVQYLGAAHGGLVINLLELDEIEQARAELAQIDRARWADGLQDNIVAFAAGELAWAEGDLDAAVAELEQADRIRRQLLPNPASGYAWVRLIEAYAEVGRAADARRVVEEVRPTAVAWGTAPVLGLLARADALVAEGRADRRRQLRHSAALLRQAGCDLQAARSLLLLGDRAASREALLLARRVGALRLLGQAEERLRELGEDPEPGTAPPEAQLSPAELRVVELAVEGQTNRQIAATLFVTVKAVEWHLSRVYRKLGIAGRSQLAAVLDRPVGDPEEVSASG